jgi:hypothetical protein
MNDQYNNPVPDDLVYLPSIIERFTHKELVIIDNAQWYDVYYKWGIELAVSFFETYGLIDEHPIVPHPDKIEYVDRCLHRYSLEDGFYHA